jgi:hypothetical protein
VRGASLSVVTLPEKLNCALTDIIIAEDASNKHITRLIIHN